MADLGAIGAVYAAIVRDKTAQPYVSLAPMYQRLVKSGIMTWTFRKWISQGLGIMLKNKLESYTFSDDVDQVAIDNPWVVRGECNIQISNDSLSKFWMELADDAASVTITGVPNKVVYHNGDLWQDVIDSHYNVANLEIVDTGGERLAGYNGMIIYNSTGRYEPDSGEVGAYAPYHLDAL